MHGRAEMLADGKCPVDVHKLTMPLEDVEFRLFSNDKPLQEKWQIGPRAIRLGNEHADLQFGNRNDFHAWIHLSPVLSAMRDNLQTFQREILNQQMRYHKRFSQAPGIAAG